MKSAELYILLALSSEDLHGYGIMQEVRRQTQGKFTLGPGTLYDNLQRLLGQALITELPLEDDSRRRVYRLSPTGRASLRGELRRLETLVRAGKRNLAKGEA